MPHVHLPADHSDADIVLAANIAATVGSEDLYVAWTHRAGPGAVPEVEAVVREEGPRSLAQLLATFVAGVVSVWQQFMQTPAAPRATLKPAASQRRATGEPQA